MEKEVLKYSFMQEREVEEREGVENRISIIMLMHKSSLHLNYRICRSHLQKRVHQLQTRTNNTSALVQALLQLAAAWF